MRDRSHTYWTWTAAILVVAAVSCWASWRAVVDERNVREAARSFVVTRDAVQARLAAPISDDPTSRGAHPPTHFVRDLFYAGLTDRLEKPLEALPAEGRVTGVLVPHHYVGSAFIHEGFRLLAERAGADPIRTVIVIGPNHDELGDAAFQTSLYEWATPFGVVAPDNLLLTDLLHNELAAVNEALAAHEHAVGGMPPFIARYLPQARIVPIMLKRKPTADETAELVAWLRGALAEPGTVLVASVDFSHYLTSAEADKRDALTLRAMRERDYATMASFGNDHIDSPISVEVFLRALDGGRFTLLRHENSGRLIDDENGFTTSYLTGAVTDLGR